MIKAFEDTWQWDESSAAAFRDVGMAAMHSDILDPSRNLLVTFSSAVNGSFQHLHPAQNAFCISYGGEPLFWRSGYYNGGQIHDALSYKASRAHNTIMVDGLMQGFDLGAYGWIPRFATGARISYVLGIFKALAMLYEVPEHADRWVNEPNAAFGGQSAAERLMGGQITDLAAVREYLDSVRGGW